MPKPKYCVSIKQEKLWKANRKGEGEGRWEGAGCGWRRGGGKVCTLII